MFDYRAWMVRAHDFIERMKVLPGDVHVEIDIAPPISMDDLEPLLIGARLRPPAQLVAFWTQASRRCRCTYEWDTPVEFAHLLRMIAPHWDMSHLWGGLDIVGPDDWADHVADMAGWGDCLRDYPKDYRFWNGSVPFQRLSNGDMLGLYVERNCDDSPVAIIGHEGCGSSHVIVPSLTSFLVRWERLAYIDPHFFAAFKSSGGQLVPENEQYRLDALDALFRTEIRDDLVLPSVALTEDQWRSSTDSHQLGNVMESMVGPLDRRKTILLGCACCRRLWGDLGEVSREGIIVAERFCEGLASPTDLEAMRARLCGKSADIIGILSNVPAMAGADGIAALLEMMQSTGSIEKLREPVLAAMEQMRSVTQEQMALERTSHRMLNAVILTLDASILAPSFLLERLDEPEQTRERHAHADLMRHIFGNPFRMVRHVIVSDRAKSLAGRVYQGDPVVKQLRAALLEEGQSELAAHFDGPDHPKGCWALDAMFDFVVPSSQ